MLKQFCYNLKWRCTNEKDLNGNNDNFFQNSIIYPVFADLSDDVFVSLSASPSLIFSIAILDQFKDISTTGVVIRGSCDNHSAWKTLPQAIAA